MGDEHEVAAAWPLADQPLHLADLTRALFRPSVEIPEGLPDLVSAEGQPRRLDAAAPRARQHAFHDDAVRAECLADLSRMSAALLGQVALGGAVVQPHAGWIAHAGCGDGVPQQHHLPARFEERPGLLAG